MRCICEIAWCSGGRVEFQPLATQLPLSFRVWHNRSWTGATFFAHQSLHVAGRPLARSADAPLARTLTTLTRGWATAAVGFRLMRATFYGKKQYVIKAAGECKCEFSFHVCTLCVIWARVTHNVIDSADTNMHKQLEILLPAALLLFPLAVIYDNCSIYNK